MSSKTPLPPELGDALAEEPDGAALERVWDLLGAAAPPPSSASDADWRLLRARVSADPPRADRPAVPAPRRARRWRRAALAAAVALAVGLGWAARPVTVQAPVGETLAVALPDGSTATLNSGATLRRGRLFWGARGTPLSGRAVALDGEAFFEVQPGRAPFVVTTHNARVEVLGTAFNVRAWAADAETSVALVHGRLRVAPRPGASGSAASAPSRTLVPGEEAVVDAARVTAGPADVERAAGWRDGALVFEDRPLGAVLREVERRYGVAFDVAPDAPVASRVSAFYAARPALDALLGDLGAASGVRFTPTADGYRVRSASGTRRPAPAPPTARP